MLTFCGNKLKKFARPNIFEAGVGWKGQLPNFL